MAFWPTKWSKFDMRKAVQIGYLYITNPTLKEAYGRE